MNFAVLFIAPPFGLSSRHINGNTIYHYKRVYTFPLYDAQVTPRFIKRSIRRSFEQLSRQKISGSLAQTFELMNWALSRLPNDPRKDLEEDEKMRGIVFAKNPWRLSPAPK